MPSVITKKLRFCLKISREFNGKTSIMFISCSYGFLDLCKLLLKNKPKKCIRETNYEGITPFEKSFSNGHLPVCLWLIAQGALSDSNPQDSNNSTLVKNIFLSPNKNLRDYNENRHSKFLRIYKWSQSVINEYYSFKFNLVSNSSPTQRNQYHDCYLGMLSRHGPHFREIFNNLIADFLGLETDESINTIKQIFKYIRPLRNAVFPTLNKKLIINKKKVTDYL